MNIRSFKEIRQQYPEEFLVLIDPQETPVSEREVEITGARDVQAYQNGNDMLEAYRNLRKEGMNVTFCTPHYKERFVIQQVPSMRIMGA